MKKNEIETVIKQLTGKNLKVYNELNEIIIVQMKHRCCSIHFYFLQMQIIIEDWRNRAEKSCCLSEEKN